MWGGQGLAGDAPAVRHRLGHYPPVVGAPGLQGCTQDLPTAAGGQGAHPPPPARLPPTTVSRHAVTRPRPAGGHEPPSPVSPRARASGIIRPVRISGLGALLQEEGADAHAYCPWPRDGPLRDTPERRRFCAGAFTVEAMRAEKRLAPRDRQRRRGSRRPGWHAVQVAAWRRWRRAVGTAQRQRKTSARPERLAVPAMGLVAGKICGQCCFLFTPSGGVGSPAAEGDARMNFRLIYEGTLPSSRSASPKEKHTIRRALHPQLAELWKQQPLV